MLARLERGAELGRGAVRAVTGQVWLLLLEEALPGEALLSTGCLKLRATCLGTASLRLAQSHRNLHPASKESS